MAIDNVNNINIFRPATLIKREKGADEKQRDRRKKQSSEEQNEKADPQKGKVDIVI